MTRHGLKFPRYSEKFKKKLVREVFEGEYSALEVARRHDIGHASIYRWMDKYGEEIFANFELNQFKESMSLPPENESSNEEREKIYASRVEELEEELRLEKLKREAYQQMIKIAEERFKISIKKKFGTKQSNK